MNAQPVWELSGWWRRVGAYILDSIVIAVLVLIPIAIAFFASGVKWDYLAQDSLDVPSGQETAFGVFVVVAILSAVIIPAVYYCWMMTKTNGQTIGKQALGIRVVKEDGTDMNPGFAFVRQILVIELLFGVIGGIVYIAQPLDFLWALWDKKNQCLHDKIVKSRVVLAEQVVPGIGSAPPQPYFTPGEQHAQPPAGYPQQPGQPYYGPLSPEGRPAPGQAPFPQAPASPAPPSVPPPPPPPGGASTPYTPPPGFENPVPDDDKD